MTKVYNQFDGAFRHVSAYAILHNGEYVARISMKHGASVVAYVHWIGAEMARGTAGGGGYDKATAAIEHAAAKMPSDWRPSFARGTIQDVADVYQAFRAALSHDDGAGWARHLERAGFFICNVIA